MVQATTIDPPLIFWGRCRSGRRWFWTANEHDGEQIHGWADTPDEASRQANAATVQLAAGRYANVRVLHGIATEQLRKLNAAKRSAKTPSARAGAVPPPDPTDFLYAVEPGRYELDDVTWVPGKVVQFPITKTTARRIYYLRPRYLYMPGPDWEPGYIDRQELERHGSVYVPYWLQVFAEPPELPTAHAVRPRRLRSDPTAAPDLKKLKAAMAAAHPDRGGTSEAFIAARERYQRAKGRLARIA